MIETIEVRNFQGIAKCKSMTFQSIESFMSINYSFKKGKVYGIISDFGCGGWGLSTCIGGRFFREYDGDVIVNNQKQSLIELKKHSCFVTDNDYNNLKINQKKDSIRKCIEKALKKNNGNYSVSEIKSIFCLSDGRFDRPLSEASGEIWLASLAIGFSLEKNIFCYPWLNEIDANRFKIANNLGVIDFLKIKEKIIIVPSSQKDFLSSFFDNMIIFREGHVYYE